MRINEGILDDLDAQSVNIKDKLNAGELGWPGDKNFSVYVTIEFVKTLEAEKLKELCDDMLLFLETQRNITEYSRMCATDSNYRLIRDIDAAIAERKKFKDFGIDFGIAHNFHHALNVIRFFTKLMNFCGKSVRIIKLRANYGREYSAPVSKVCAEYMKKIFIDKKKTQQSPTQDAMNDALKIANIFIPNNDDVALEIINAAKHSFDIYAYKMRAKFIPISQQYSDFELNSKTNYLQLPEELYQKMLDTRLTWDQISSFDNVHSAIHDLISTTNGGEEINANRSEVIKVLNEHPVKIHDAVFRFNETKDKIFICVTTNPFLVDSKRFFPNFEVAIFTYWMWNGSDYYKWLKIIWPWMTYSEYKMIFESLK